MLPVNSWRAVCRQWPVISRLHFLRRAAAKPGGRVKEAALFIPPLHHFLLRSPRDHTLANLLVPFWFPSACFHRLLTSPTPRSGNSSIWASTVRLCLFVSRMRGTKKLHDRFSQEYQDEKRRLSREAWWESLPPPLIRRPGSKKDITAILSLKTKRELHWTY